MEPGIRRERVGGWVDPATAFEALYSDAEYAFWLDGGASGISLMGEAGSGASIMTVSVGAGALVRSDTSGNVREVLQASLFEFLRDQQRAGHVETGGPPVPFSEGWIGWLGYELGADAVGAPTAQSRYPDAALMFVDRSVSFDPSTGTVTITAGDATAGDATSGHANGAAEWMTSTLATLESVRGRQPTPRGTEDRSGSHGEEQGTWRHDDTAYLQMVRACQSAIADGDAYVLCLTNELRIASRVEPIDAYLRLRTMSPTTHGGLVRFGNLSLVSASPEQFLRVTSGGLITTRPVKGTRPRGVDAADDERLRSELLSSEKERAENLMIVDLMRNDLARVARPGTVEVTQLLEVETYAPVHQLVSTVRARLGEGFEAIDAVRSCFPAGSMTGTPKLSAMAILGELEDGPRGIYSGCFGLFSTDGSIEVSMVIRSIVVDGSGVSIGAGGGVTSMSIPDEELAEVKLKADLLATVVRASAVH